jgi:hypothetical protein
MSLLISALTTTLLAYLAVGLILKLADQFKNPWKLTIYSPAIASAPSLEQANGIRQLKSMASDLAIKGYGRLTKAQLASAIALTLAEIS